MKYTRNLLCLLLNHLGSRRVIVYSLGFKTTSEICRKTPWQDTAVTHTSLMLRSSALSWKNRQNILDYLFIHERKTSTDGAVLKYFLIQTVVRYLNLQVLISLIEPHKLQFQATTFHTILACCVQ